MLMKNKPRIRRTLDIYVKGGLKVPSEGFNDEDIYLYLAGWIGPLETTESGTLANETKLGKPAESDIYKNKLWGIRSECHREWASEVL